MNFELEDHDIEQIATKVAAKLLPLLRKESSKKNSIEWLTVEEVAKMLNVEKSWVYRQKQLGEIPYTKPGKYVMFRKDKIEAWLDNNSVRQSGRYN
jgi:excisionase family DNA binding protein